MAVGLDALARIPLFSGLSKRHLRRILKATSDYDYKEGHTIVRQGDEGEALFVVLEGRARVVRSGRTVVRLGPGDFFGEIAVLNKRPRTASVVADSPLRCLVLHRDELRKILADEPRAAWAMLGALAARRGGTNGDSPGARLRRGLRSHPGKSPASS